MDDIRRKKGKMNGGKSEGEMNHGRLWTLRNKQGFREEGAGGWVSPGDGIKEGMYCMEHWVLYANNESWNTISKTNDVMYGD